MRILENQVKNFGRTLKRNEQLNLKLDEQTDIITMQKALLNDANPKLLKIIKLETETVE
jgi:hypothetical protein